MIKPQVLEKQLEKITNFNSNFKKIGENNN
jgi:hypothetical protein